MIRILCYLLVNVNNHFHPRQSHGFFCERARLRDSAICNVAKKVFDRIKCTHFTHNKLAKYQPRLRELDLF